MCVLSLYKGHLTKLRPFVLSFCRTYHIGTLIFVVHSYHPSPHLVIVLLDVTSGTHHHFPTCIIRAVLLPPVPHQDSLICAAPVSPITYRSLIIRAAFVIRRPGRASFVLSFVFAHHRIWTWIMHAVTSVSYRGFSSSSFVMSFCHTYIIGLGSIYAVLCHFSRVKACIRAVTVVAHHIRTCVLCSVTSATHYHTCNLIILALSFRALMLVTDSYIRSSFVLPICHS